MADIIKFLNMETIFEEITVGMTDEEENKVNETLTAIEEQEEFIKLFFYSDKEMHQYYYLESQEQAIKDYFSKQIDISSIEYCFRLFSDELDENRTGEVIEFQTHIGIITINEDNITDALIDEYLTEEDYINRLINAEDFEQEMKELKKECLEFLFDLQIEIIREELEKYQFDYFA